MIVKTFEFSVAAGAAAVNLMPDDFNPVPGDGILDVHAVLDSGITGLTAPPTIEIVIGGATAETPVRKSSITGDAYALQVAGNFGEPINPVLTNYPVRNARNLQLNVAGGTGATATGRIKVTFRTANEVGSGLMS